MTTNAILYFILCTMPIYMMFGMQENTIKPLMKYGFNKKKFEIADCYARKNTDAVYGMPTILVAGTFQLLSFFVLVVLAGNYMNLYEVDFLQKITISTLGFLLLTLVWLVSSIIIIKMQTASLYFEEAYLALNNEKMTISLQEIKELNKLLKIKALLPSDLSKFEDIQSMKISEYVHLFLQGKQTEELMSAADKLDRIDAEKKQILDEFNELKTTSGERH